MVKTQDKSTQFSSICLRSSSCSLGFIPVFSQLTLSFSSNLSATFYLLALSKLSLSYGDKNRASQMNYKKMTLDLKFIGECSKIYNTLYICLAKTNHESCWQTLLDLIFSVCEFYSDTLIPASLIHSLPSLHSHCFLFLLLAALGSAGLRLGAQALCIRANLHVEINFSIAKN